MSLAEQAGEDAEALLRQLMTIYDVKTLVAELVSVGEQHWSAAILKRVVALGRVAERLRPQEVAHLATLLPSPPAHHPHYGFRFIDLFAGIGGIRSGFEAIGGQCVFTSEWNKHAVRTYKANWYCDPQQHRLMKISVILPSANVLTLATRRRRGIFVNLSLSMMCCWLASLPAFLACRRL